VEGSEGLDKAKVVAAGSEEVVSEVRIKHRMGPMLQFRINMISVPIILGCNRKVKVLSIFQEKGRNSH
jgi:hypothetical protein